jgi:hypothetical protein
MLADFFGIFFVMKCAKEKEAKMLCIILQLACEILRGSIHGRRCDCSNHISCLYV